MRRLFLAGYLAQDFERESCVVLRSLFQLDGHLVGNAFYTAM